MKINFHDKIFIDKFYPAFTSKVRYLLLFGGSGSGKSYSASQKKIIRTLKEDHHRILFLRKTARSIRQSSFQLTKSLISRYNLSSIYEFKENEMKIVNKLNKNEIISSGLDDVEKLKSVFDPTSAWIEESTEISEDEFDQVDLRLRGLNQSYFQIIMTFNPIDERHWIRKRFFAEIPDDYFMKESFFYSEKNDALIMHSTAKDNHFAGETYHQVLQRMKISNPSFYEIYAKGIWGTPELGHIFRPEFYDEYDFAPDDIRSVIYCDPNLSIKGKGDTTAITELGYSARFNQYYILNAVCRSFADSSELLNTVLKMKQDSRTAISIGFDGNVSQESTWTNLIRSWCKDHNAPFPVVEFKRYRIDDLAKNAQLIWSEGKIKFPLMFKERIENKDYITQVFSFKGKKKGNPDDAPDSLIGAFEMLHERKLVRSSSSDDFKQPDIKMTLTI